MAPKAIPPAPDRALSSINTASLATAGDSALSQSTEYANAIRDLLALEIDPAPLLLADDESYSFDNIA